MCGTGRGFSWRGKPPSLSQVTHKRCSFTQRQLRALESTFWGSVSENPGSFHLMPPSSRKHIFQVPMAEGERESWMTSHQFFNALSQKGHVVPLLTAHWPELVTWPQTNCKGSWEMLGALGYPLRLTCLCYRPFIAARIWKAEWRKRSLKGALDRADEAMLWVKEPRDRLKNC